MPNVRVVNTIPQITRKTDFPQSRVSRFQTGKIGEPKIISKIGVPIGLLLTLTYIEEVSLSSLFYSDFRPTARVTNP